MGIGYLFLGYLLTLNLVARPYFSLLPAMILILVGMAKLGAYNRPLREARLALIPTAALSVLAFILECGRLFSAADTFFNGIDAYLSPALLLFLALFTDRLLTGLASLAKETELPKVEFAAKRNRLLSAIAYAVYFLCDLPIRTDAYASLVAHAFAPILLLRLVVTAMNAYLIFSCYMQICLPEDVDMPRKKTGIAFLDEMNEKMDKREEARIAEKKEALSELYREREEKYRQKQQKSNKKGKKK